MNKTQLRAIYRLWEREEVEAIAVIEALGQFLNSKPPKTPDWIISMVNARSQPVVMESDWTIKE